MSDEEEIEIKWVLNQNSYQKSKKKLIKLCDDNDEGYPTAFLDYKFKNEDVKFTIETNTINSTFTIGFASKETFKSKKFSWNCNF
jgi:hypothetical protein